MRLSGRGAMPLATIPYPMLTGPRVVLRELLDSDLDFIADMLADREVMRFWPRPMDREESELWIRCQRDRYAEHGCGYWLAIDHTIGRAVGQAGVLMTEVDEERLPAVGYMMHRPFWRSGYALEAAQLCLQFIFDVVGAPTAYALVRPENQPSVNLAVRLGMEPVRAVEYAGYQHILFAIRQPSTR